MKGYQRFIAYVYEYHKGKKGENIGYVKVEKKQARCSMEFHLQYSGLAPGLTCKLYGFVRKEEKLQGILLGVCEMERDRVDCSMEMDAYNLHRSGVRLEELGGLVLRLEGGGFLGTEWDDRPIQIENFVEMQTSAEVVPETEQKEEEKEQNVVADKEQKEGEGKAEIGEIEATEWKEEVFSPFEDEEVTGCKKVDLEDLVYLNGKDKMLRNNRFLQYAYYQFGHLLMGELKDGNYIIGVPGFYNQQEQLLANMFGFPNFKFSTKMNNAQKKGGYWYRLINPPNRDRGNRAL